VNRVVACVLVSAAALAATPRGASADGDDLGKLLAAAVDLPTEKLRLAAAAKLAEREDVTLDAWLAAMRAFGGFESPRPGTRTEKATLAVGDAKEDATIAVHVPPSAGVEKSGPAPLLLALHGSGGEGHDSDDLWNAVADDLGMIVVAPTDPNATLGYSYTEPERQRALAALRWARRKFDVDETRVYVTGVSRGAHLAWDLALRRPDLFAALVPMIGGPRLSPAEGHNNLRYVENLVATPIRDLQGAKDDAYLLDNLRHAFRRLDSLGARDAKLVEFPDKGHDFDPAAVDWRKFLGGAAREPVPLRVVRACAKPEEARASWIEALTFGPTVKETFRVDIDEKKLNAMNETQKREWIEGECEKRTARIEGKIAGPGKFEVKTNLVLRFRLRLSRDMFDPASPVEVTLGDKTTKYEAKPSKLVLLRDFVERFDRTFLPVAEISCP